MKILYLHQYFNTRDMVGGTRSYEMARRLVAAGHEVHVVTSDRDAPETVAGWRESVVDGIHVHWVAVPYSNRMNYAARMRAFLHFAYAAGLRSARIGGDVVFATSTPLTIALPAVFAARRLRVPMVLEIRDLWPDVPIAMGVLKSRWSQQAGRWLERFAYRNAAAIVALAPGMAQAVRDKGFAAKPMAVIPNGADLDLFGVAPERAAALRRETPWLGTRPLIVYCGTIGLANGVEYIVRLAAAVAAIDPNVRFAVIGDGREVGDVRAAAARLGVLDRNFFLLGPIPKRDVSPWLDAADAALVVYAGPEIVWRDSVPNKFFDAIAAGRLVFANYHGWAPLLAAAAGAAVILPDDDVNAAARDVVARMRDPDAVAAAGRRARAFAEERFSRDILAQQLELVLRDAIAPAHAAVRSRLKRAIDIVAAGLILVALAPVLAAVALVVVLSMGRPVLFRQERPGLGGRLFHMLKFRTMRDARDAQGRPLPDDQRLTGIGRFLRSTSLDELPELWNVLRGDMSLVGPRPLLPSYLGRYTPEQARRHHVRPGVTGWAQINGRNAVDWETRLSLDVWYVDHWTPWLDLRILLRTVSAVLRREGVSAAGHATMPEFLGTSAPKDSR